MNSVTIKARLAMVRKGMRTRDLSCLVASGPANVTYLTGFMGEDSWVLLTAGRCILITDSRFDEQARHECIGCEIISRKGGMTQELQRLAGRGKGRIGVEGGMTASAFAAIRKAMGSRVVLAAGVVESVRQIKDAAEARAISKAARIAWEALDEALGQLRAGMAEMELAAMIDYGMHRRGVGNSFPTIVAFGPNGSRPHHSPGSRKLRNNDTILIDFGAKFRGYCCDMTRCFAVGRVSRQYAHAYDGVLAAKEAATAAVRAGVAVKDVEAAARAVLTDRGLPQYGHGTGHGLGLEIHEGPAVSQRSEAVLAAGQTITIEPGVYVPGKFGIRIEDDVLVTENGCRLLSGGSTKFRAGELQVLKLR